MGPNLRENHEKSKKLGLNILLSDLDLDISNGRWILALFFFNENVLHFSSGFIRISHDLMVCHYFIIYIFLSSLKPSYSLSQVSFLCQEHLRQMACENEIFIMCIQQAAFLWGLLWVHFSKTVLKMNYAMQPYCQKGFYKGQHEIKYWKFFCNIIF